MFAKDVLLWYELKSNYNHHHCKNYRDSLTIYISRIFVMWFYATWQYAPFELG